MIKFIDAFEYYLNDEEGIIIGINIQRAILFMETISNINSRMKKMK
jgi:uncharacterized protein YuzE